MNRDFYATMAQVLPVLLLALMWDSNYLQRLRAQSRPLRREEPGGIWFWTKRRLRLYLLLVAGVLVTAVGVSLLVLAGALPDSAWLRGVLVGALLLALITLMVRISTDVVRATRGP